MWRKLGLLGEVPRKTARALDERRLLGFPAAAAASVGWRGLDASGRRSHLGTDREKNEEE